MKTINIIYAKKNLYSLIEDVFDNSSQVVITNSKGKNVVMISEEEYNGLQETIYLHSIPGLVEGILEAAIEDPKNMKEYNPKEDW